MGTTHRILLFHLHLDTARLLQEWSILPDMPKALGKPSTSQAAMPSAQSSEVEDYAGLNIRKKKPARPKPIKRNPAKPKKPKKKRRASTQSSLGLGAIAEEDALEQQSASSTFSDLDLLHEERKSMSLEVSSASEQASASGRKASEVSDDLLLGDNEGQDHAGQVEGNREYTSFSPPAEPFNQEADYSTWAHATLSSHDMWAALRHNPGLRRLWRDRWLSKFRVTKPRFPWLWRWDTPCIMGVRVFFPRLFHAVPFTARGGDCEVVWVVAVSPLCNQCRVCCAKLPLYDGRVEAEGGRQKANDRKFSVSLSTDQSDSESVMSSRSHRSSVASLLDAEEGGSSPSAEVPQSFATKKLAGRAYTVSGELAWWASLTGMAQQGTSSKPVSTPSSWILEEELMHSLWLSNVDPLTMQRQLAMSLHKERAQVPDITLGACSGAQTLVSLNLSSSGCTWAGITGLAALDFGGWAAAGHLECPDAQGSPFVACMQLQTVLVRADGTVSLQSLQVGAAHDEKPHSSLPQSLLRRMTTDTPTEGAPWFDGAHQLHWFALRHFAAPDAEHPWLGADGSLSLLKDATLPTWLSHFDASSAVAVGAVATTTATFLVENATIQRSPFALVLQKSPAPEANSDSTLGDIVDTIRAVRFMHPRIPSTVLKDVLHAPIEKAKSPPLALPLEYHVLNNGSEEEHGRLRFRLLAASEVRDEDNERIVDDSEHTFRALEDDVEDLAAIESLPFSAWPYLPRKKLTNVLLEPEADLSRQEAGDAWPPEAKVRGLEYLGRLVNGILPFRALKPKGGPLSRLSDLQQRVRSRLMTPWRQQHEEKAIELAWLHAMLGDESGGQPACGADPGFLDTDLEVQSARGVRGAAALMADLKKAAPPFAAAPPLMSLLQADGSSEPGQGSSTAAAELQPSNSPAEDERGPMSLPEVTTEIQRQKVQQRLEAEVEYSSDIEHLESLCFEGQEFKQRLQELEGGGGGDKEGPVMPSNRKGVYKAAYGKGFQRLRRRLSAYYGVMARVLLHGDDAWLDDAGEGEEEKPGPAIAPPSEAQIEQLDPVEGYVRQAAAESSASQSWAWPSQYHHRASLKQMIASWQRAAVIGHDAAGHFDEHGGPQ